METAPVPARPDPAGSIERMFGRIARHYDLLNHTLSFGIDRWWRYRLARHVRPGQTGRVLDLAAGTLDVSLEIRRQHPGLRILALDFCLPMLEYGVAKCRKKKATDIFPVAADVRALPLPDASVDCVAIAFGIRNITPRSAAWAEMLRVLTPGGRACVLEFGGGSSRIWQGLYSLYLRRLLPLIGRIVSGDKAYQYLADTIETFPDAALLAHEMRVAGFAQVFHLPLTSGIVCLHVAEKTS